MDREETIKKGDACSYGCSCFDKFYKIKITGLPKILFAHSYETDNYDISFLGNGLDIIELSYIEEGDVIRQEGSGESCFFKAPFYLTSFHNRPYNMRCETGRHRHYTVGINVTYDIEIIDRFQVVSFGHRFGRGFKGAGKQHNSDVFIVLPVCIDSMLYILDIKKMIMGIIGGFNSLGGLNVIGDVSSVFQVFDSITQLSIKIAEGFEEEGFAPGNLLYVDRAVEYVGENLSSQIKIKDIAESLGVSEGYLSRVFKDTTGQTLIEYINKAKIDRVKELILSKNLTLKQAGEVVGINDENYLSRLFKKHSLVSVSEFKKGI